MQEAIAIITPKKLAGSVIIPPSKSLAHRAIICACLSRGESEISNVVTSDDILATIDCMRKLGAKIDILSSNRLHIKGGTDRICANLQFDCNESGSTLRFILPIALALNSGENKFVGRGKLGERPMKIYEEICKKQGVEYIDKSLANERHFLNLSVKGELKSGVYRVDGGVSSQFITGLLFALPLLDGDSEIIIEGNLQSVGYLDLTLSALEKFGIQVRNDGYKKLSIKGGQSYRACEYYVEGDYSQSAFYEVANYLGCDVDMIGLNAQSLQGDKVIVDFVDRLRRAGESEILTFDGGNCPDIIPVFALACCLRKGHTDIINISRLKIKECDRLAATAGELSKLGAKITQGDDCLSIDGVDKLSGGVVDSHNDHRMAMMLAIASTVAKGEVKIYGAQSVTKSYPNFFTDLGLLGGEYEFI